MKKLVRKSMFVLSFLGLFTFGVPKQAKADSISPCTTYHVTCADGTVHNVIACDYEELLEGVMVACNISIQK
ncbi:MAG: hypothetical protein IJ057_06990 [Bacteroidales bacterium]|nr:hypothetical protein [Bacteroidales bacterium]